MNLTTKLFVALQLAILAIALAFYVTAPAHAMASLPQKQCFAVPIDPLNAAFCSQFYALPAPSNDKNPGAEIVKRERPTEEGEGGGESGPSEGGAMETLSEPAPAQGD